MLMAIDANMNVKWLFCYPNDVWVLESGQCIKKKNYPLLTNCSVFFLKVLNRLVCYCDIIDRQ